MNLDALHLWVLLLLLLAPLPLFSTQLRTGSYSWVALLPGDRASSAIDIGLRVLAILVASALVLGMAGLYLVEQTVERIGRGAHIVLLFDRSSSMDQTFAGDTPTGGEEAKSTAARRLLSKFVSRRENDLFGVAAFSTSPIFILPLTRHRGAIQAAVRAINRRGLAYTHVAGGLGMALSYFENQPLTGSRVIVLVSDGAAVIDREGRAELRTWFEKYRPSLYWVYMRTAGTPGIYAKPDNPSEDSAQAMPERHLHEFFKSLVIPYRAYQAENPEALEAAIADIGGLENKPLRYTERVPKRDLSWIFYTAALAGMILLLAAKFAEVRVWR